MLNPDNHVIEYVDDFVHDALDHADARVVREHCQRCRICQAALEEAQKRLEIVRSIPPAEPSEPLIQATLSRIQACSKRRAWDKPRVMKWIGMALAACITIAAGIHAYIATLEPSSPDLNVLWQSELWAGSDASMRLRMVNHETGLPIANASVSVEIRQPDAKQWVQLASFKTDSSGTGNPKMKLPDWKTGDYEVRVLAKAEGSGEELHRTVKLRRAWRLMLSTDKPVYQPGQTIHMRGLALRKPNLKPVAGEEVVFTVADPRGNILFKQKGVTSAYGISSADCALDTEILEGAYAIECRVGDTSSTQTVEVKRYVLPKFRLDVELDKPWYLLSDTVRGTVKAEYFFGKPVAGAIIQIEPRGVTGKLPAIALTADADGRATFELRLPGRTVSNVGTPFNDRLILDISARDTAGQEQKRTRAAIVTSEPLVIEIIPEAGTLIRQTENTVFILVRYADGTPAKARLAVSGHPSEIQTNELGVASLAIKPSGDEIDVTVCAIDARGLVVNKTIRLTCGQQDLNFAVRTDRAVYQAGQTMQLSVIGQGAEPVFVDLLKDNQVLLTQAITPGQPLALDLPPEVYGTLQLTAYRFSNWGVPARKTQVIYVRPPEGVKIAAALDRDEYQPGGRAKLALSLTDTGGKPVAGAISLSAVDEAVFSVLEAAPGMEKIFFTLEKELLKPVYAIYDWSPDLASGRSEDVQLLEKAIFARTAMLDSNDERARLLKEQDITPEVFEALNRPDVEQILKDSGMEPAMRQRILAMRGSQAVFVSTWPEKAQRISQIRHQGEATMTTVWIVLGIAALLFVLMLLNSIGQAVVLLFVLLFVASMMLPSLNRAREQANRVKCLNDLRQIESAMTLSDNDNRNKLKTPSDQAQAPRLRQWFPETLLWRPELITDNSGRASLDIDLADSITTWRLSASAVTSDGRLGAMRSGIRVFQPFFVDLDLPVALVRNDEITIPVAIYNYLDRPQKVDLVLEKGDWFDLLGESASSLTLAKGDVRSVSYRIRARKVGLHTLTIAARGETGVGDAVKRAIEVVPNGQRVERVWNGTLQQPAIMQLVVPPTAIDGSAKAFVKIYPSSFSQLVEGLDGIFQRPYGCFEQTSSTTYPNVLALDYLQRTRKNAPEVEAKAKQYIHLGYQRLIGFEVIGGGFDWFGRSPANRVLTAYGLMEFEDMARVHAVDPRLIERTRNWLLNCRNADGSWSPESHGMLDDPSFAVNGNLGTTAYIAWSVFAGGKLKENATLTRDWLLRYRPDQIGDPYMLALVANALLEMDKAVAQPYVQRLASLRQSSDNDKFCWWDCGPNRRTMFYGAGQSGSIETTALAVLAMIRHGGMAGPVRGGLAWLVSQKDSLGTWHSTQATVLALRAILAGTGAPLGNGQDRIVQIEIDGNTQKLVIPAGQDDVMKQIDLSAFLKAGQSASVKLNELSNSQPGYQVSFRYHIPDDSAPAESQPLAISLDFDKTEVVAGEALKVRAIVTNRQAQAAPMVIVDLPIPAGFVAGDDALSALRNAPLVEKVQVTPRSIVVYLRSLAPGVPLQLDYRLQAVNPANVTAPPAEVYEYYDPARRAKTPERKLTVLQKV